MIAFLDGTVLVAGTEAVIAVGGVGLEVHFSALGAERLPAAGQPVRLWTHLVVRDDVWALYGFPDPDERRMFRLLISVSGVGPKVALNMLSRTPPAEIARHLRTGDEKALAALPGIGKKSAARLVIELGQRVPQEGTAGFAGADPQTGPLGEALAVLGAMGLPAAAAEGALRRARAENPGLDTNLEAWVRAALRHI